MSQHTIGRVEVPSRSRLWTPEEADQVFALLTENNEDGKAVTFGRYTDKEGEQRARTQGNSLNNLIAQRHGGRRFGITVYRDPSDKENPVVGALLPRAAKKNTGKAAAGQNRKASPSRGKGSARNAA